MKAFIYASIMISFCLTSCIDKLVSVPNFPPALLAPQVVLSQNSAPLRDYVTITVSGGYFLPSPNETKEITILDTRLGICFIPSETLIDNSDTVCEDLSLPANLEVEGNAPLFIEGDVTLKKGETVELSHSVRLRSEQAQGLTVVGYYAAPDGEGGVSVSVYGLHEGRAFVKFK